MKNPIWKFLQIFLTVIIIIFLMNIFGTDELGNMEYAVVGSLFILIAILDYIIAQKIGYSTIDKINTAIDAIGKPFFKMSDSFHRISIAVFVIGLLFIATVIGYMALLIEV